MVRKLVVRHSVGMLSTVCGQGRWRLVMSAIKLQCVICDWDKVVMLCCNDNADCARAVSWWAMSARRLARWWKRCDCEIVRSVSVPNWLVSSAIWEIAALDW